MRIRVPATSANLGPGFDTLGMALRLYNYFEATPAEKLALEGSPSSSVDISDMPLTPRDNLLGKAYEAYFRFRGCPVISADLVIEAHIPLSRGLGSSSTAIVAGLFLADAMHPEPLGKEALIPWAVELEGHPDNVTPAVLGGIRCCLSNGTSFPLPWPEPWGIILVVPPERLNTRRARDILPKQYPLSAPVENIRGMAAWIQAVQQQDADRFGYALGSDTLHQPARGSIIPEFPILKTLIEPTEAMGCVISGSGSTLAVYTPDYQTQKAVLALLEEPGGKLSHCEIIPTRVDRNGVTLVTQGCQEPDRLPSI